MKYVRLFALASALTGLFGVANIGAASATELTCGSPMCAANTTIHAESEGHIIIDSLIGNIECGSTLEGTTENTGSSSETVRVKITTHAVSTCNAAVTVVANGTWEIHTQQATANNNGTVTSTGTKITVETSGFHCIFETNNTDIGTLTGSATTGKTATLDISAAYPRVGGRSGAFCGSSAPWTGSYLIDTPMVLNVD